MDKYMSMTQELLDFISKSPTSFHGIENIAGMLDANGAKRLWESSAWSLEKGKSYYVIRGGSALIAFTLPEGRAGSYHIVASHSDSPAFKIKENPELKKSEHYIELNVEKYGGALLNPWFDRPLSVAGRVLVDENGMIKSRLVDFDRDLCMIPSLAIHMNREANEGGKIDIQKTMMPLLGDESAKDSFIKMLARLADAAEEQIVGSDLFIYNRVAPSIWGANNEFFSAGRIDDLMCAFASVKAFTEYVNGEAGTGKSAINMCAVFDNEEVGSSSKQGADSTFLTEVMERIGEGLGMSREDYRQAVSQSFMVSADNGHALHPNYPDKSDPTNQPFMNKGVVIKYNAAQKYTTDGISAAIFKKICDNENIPWQTYVNHSNVAGGSTLGNIANTHVSMNTVDIGAAQLAMHSPYETAGVKDVLYLEKAMLAFYNADISECEGLYRVK